MAKAAVLDEVYGPGEREAAGRLADLVAPPQTAETIGQSADVLGEVEVVLSSWGMPVVDALFLAHAPRLKVVFYAAGSVRGFVTEALWERGVRVSSAQAGNAEPVANYAVAATVLALKGVWRLSTKARSEGALPARAGVGGVRGATVGVISLGFIGGLVCQQLSALGTRVLAYDPYTSAGKAAGLGAELCSLEPLFERSQVVTVHAPLLPGTEGMVTGELVARLPMGGALVNTARGALVNEPELVEVLRRRPDLTAVLDVTHPEPPAPGSPLYQLPNVVLTPHVAGALGGERRHLGRMMVDELRRYLAGVPLAHEVFREGLSLSATP